MAPILSASQVLATELAAAASKLQTLDSRLGAAQAGAAAARRRNTVTLEAACMRVVQGEEALAVREAAASSAEELRKKLAVSEAQLADVERVRSSQLYWRWRQAFEEHLRGGGCLEDFPLDSFLNDFCGSVPLTKLHALRTAAESWEENARQLQAKLKEERELQASVRLQASSVAGELKALQKQIQECKKTTVWSNEGPLQGLQLREMHSKLQLDTTEWEHALLHCEQSCSVAFAAARARQQEAAGLRQQVASEQALAEEQAILAEAASARLEELRIGLGLQDQELIRHKLVPAWTAEARRAARQGQRHQQEAMELLRTAAQERAAVGLAEDELLAVAEGLRERHLEATALRSAWRHTSHHLEAVEADLQGLRTSYSDLYEQHAKVVQLLSQAQAVALSPRLQNLGLTGVQDHEQEIARSSSNLNGGHSMWSVRTRSERRRGPL